MWPLRRHSLSDEQLSYMSYLSYLPYMSATQRRRTQTRHEALR